MALLVVLMSSSTVWGNDKGPKNLIIIYESLYTNQRAFGAPCVTYTCTCTYLWCYHLNAICVSIRGQ